MICIVWKSGYIVTSLQVDITTFNILDQLLYQQTGQTPSNIHTKQSLVYKRFITHKLQLQLCLEQFVSIYHRSSKRQASELGTTTSLEQQETLCWHCFSTNKKWRNPGVRTKTLVGLNKIL